MTSCHKHMTSHCQNILTGLHKHDTSRHTTSRHKPVMTSRHTTSHHKHDTSRHTTSRHKHDTSRHTMSRHKHDTSRHTTSRHKHDTSRHTTSCHKHVMTSRHTTSRHKHVMISVTTVLTSSQWGGLSGSTITLVVTSPRRDVITSHHVTDRLVFSPQGGLPRGARSLLLRRVADGAGEQEAAALLSVPLPLPASSLRGAAVT